MPRQLRRARAAWRASLSSPAVCSRPDRRASVRSRRARRRRRACISTRIGLADPLADLLADDARHHVDAAAGRERHQQADRPAGKLGLRQRVRCGGAERHGGKKRAKQRAQQRLEASASVSSRSSRRFARRVNLRSLPLPHRIGMSLVWLPRSRRSCNPRGQQ